MRKVLFNTQYVIFKKKLLHRNNKLMKRKVNKYNKAGVNIDEGNNFIKLIKKFSLKKNIYQLFIKLSY